MANTRKRHCVFDCPHFQGLRQQHAEIFQYSHDAMSGDVRDPPPCSQSIVLYRMQFAEEISRLMSPFSKDETGHES